MAITSYGYPGLIAAGAAWAQMQQLLGRQRMVVDENDFAPSINGSAARTVRLAPGTAGGEGILDVSNANEDVALPATSSTQYFLVGLSRRWGANNNTVKSYVAGTSARRIPAFTVNPGTQSFHPLALARVAGGGTEITDLVDLRTVAQEPGVYTIFDDLALPLVARPGVLVYNRVSGFSYMRVYDGTSWVWKRLTPSEGGLLNVLPVTWFNFPLSGRLTGGWRVFGNPSQSTLNVASVTIPDPGVPYRVQAEMAGFYGTELSGTRWDFDFRVGNVTIDTSIGSRDENDAQHWKRLVSLPSRQVFTGTQTFYFRARRIYGTGFGAVATWDREGRVAVYAAG